MKILIISPLHDNATFISNIAVKHLQSWIHKENNLRYDKGVSTIEYKVLTGINANRLGLYLNKNVDALFYYGHGLKDRLGGFLIHLLPILDKKNVKWLKGKIIYTMACLSGIKLAKEAIKAGVRAYFGQIKQYFGFIPSIHYPYLSDWYELINIIPKSLMLGDSAFRALSKYETLAHNLYVKYLNIYNKKNMPMLFSNALYMELIGDKMAKIC